MASVMEFIFEHLQLRLNWIVQNVCWGKKKKASAQLWTQWREGRPGFYLVVVRLSQIILSLFCLSNEKHIDMHYRCTTLYIFIELAINAWLCKSPKHSGRNLYHYLFKLHYEVHTNTPHASLSFKVAIRNQNLQMIKQMLHIHIAWHQDDAFNDKSGGTWRTVCKFFLIEMDHKENNNNSVWSWPCITPYPQKHSTSLTKK